MGLHERYFGQSSEPVPTIEEMTDASKKRAFKQDGEREFMTVLINDNRLSLEAQATISQIWAERITS